MPEMLKVDESTLQGQLFPYRISNGITYSTLVKKIGLDKSTIARFERGFKVKVTSRQKIINYLSLICPSVKQNNYPLNDY